MATVSRRWAGANRYRYVDHTPGWRQWQLSSFFRGLPADHLWKPSSRTSHYWGQRYRHRHADQWSVMLLISATLPDEQRRVKRSRSLWPVVSQLNQWLHSRWPMVLRSSCSCRAPALVRVTLTRRAATSLSVTFRVITILYKLCT